MRSQYQSILLFLAHFCAIISFFSGFSKEGLPNTWALWAIGLLMFIGTDTNKDKQ